MRRSIALLLLFGLAPAPLLAQEATRFVKLDWVEGVTPQIAIADCEPDTGHALTWALDTDPSSAQKVDVYVSESEACTYETRVADVETYDPALSTATTTVRASMLVPGCDPVDSTRYVCLRLTGGAANDTTSLEATVDTVRPETPEVSEAVAGDALVRVTFDYPGDPPADLASHRIRYRLAGSMDPPIEGPTLSPASLRTGTLTGLQNGVTYEVWVVAIDDAGNPSLDPPSGVLATPAPTRDFWEYYKSKGGRAQGCQTGTGMGGPVALVLLFGLVLRRRRWSLRLLPLLIGLGLAAPAPAQTAREASRNWFVEVELGPYRPEVDSEPSLSGETPYRDIFGDDVELMFRLRLERAVWHGFGQVDVGFGAGFSQAVGKARFNDGRLAPDTTVFNWLPLELTASYRFDNLALEWGIPFVPFVRVGLDYTVWWILDGSGGVAVTDAGEAGQGGQLGYRYGGGLMLLLDFLDPRLATDFQRSSGVDNSYLYLEVVRLELDGLGAPAFVLSDTTWSAGLAIEF